MKTRLMTLLASALILGLILTTLPTDGSAETGFTVSLPAQIRPYRNESIALDLPADGILTIHAQVQGKRLLIVKEQPVQKGSLSIPFAGLSINDEALLRGEARLQAQLVTGDKTLEATAAFRVMQPAAGISYVLLSRDSMSIHDEESLYADHQLSRAGTLIVSLYREGEDDKPLFRRSFTRKDTLPHAYRWDKTIAGKPAPAGNYYFLFEAQGSQQEPIRRPFILTEEPANPPGIEVTKKGHFLPESMDDASVWAAMMAPITVIDIGASQHQRVYAEPSTKSKVVGMMHGQSAGVEILEVGPAGYLKIRAARHGDGKWMIGYIPDNRLKTITPYDRYGLLIDKNAQTISVYERGKKLGTLKISTGIYVPPGVNSFDTVPGAFLTKSRVADFPSEGIRYEYAMRIDGGNLLHGSGYRIINGQRDYSFQTERLGQIASHGCVRVQHDLNEQDLNAWWLYANLPRNTKLLVLPSEDNLRLEGEQAPETVEDALMEDAITHVTEEEPEMETEPENTSEPAANEQAPSFQVVAAVDLGAPVPEGSTLITMTFGGDCVLGSEEHSKNKPESFHSVIEQHGMAWPFSGLSDILQADDISMVNLENVLQDTRKGFNQRLHNFRGPSEFANILKLGGIELVNIANNHFVDYGQDGKNSTRNALRAAGVPFAGYSALYVHEKDGIKIGFGGIRETVFHQNHKRVADEIDELKRMGADYIVYTCHFGIEYETSHNEIQTMIARAAIDAGANLVIGHHTHVVQGIEQYKGGLIFYSLGNLVFGGNLELSTFDGLMAQIGLVYEGKQLKETRVQFIPVITSGIRPHNDFRPVAAEGEDKARILAAINADSDQDYPDRFIIPAR